MEGRATIYRDSYSPICSKNTFGSGSHRGNSKSEKPNQPNAQKKKIDLRWLVFGKFLTRDSSHLIELFGEIDDLIDLIYLIDMINIINSIGSVILISYM